MSHLESEDNNTQPKEVSWGLVPWDFAYPASLKSWSSHESGLPVLWLCQPCTACISLLLTRTEVRQSLKHSSAIFTVLQKPEASTAAGNFLFLQVFLSLFQLTYYNLRTLAGCLNDKTFEKHNPTHPPCLEGKSSHNAFPLRCGPPQWKAAATTSSQEASVTWYTPRTEVFSVSTSDCTNWSMEVLA